MRTTDAERGWLWRGGTWAVTCCLLPGLLGGAVTARAAGQTAIPVSMARRIQTSRVQGIMARSGIRALLGEAGFHGELLNRASSYRMARQLEHARTSGLEGRITALEQILEDPSLPPEERSRLERAIAESRAEMLSVPEYPVRYSGAVVQAETMVPLSHLAGRPQFLHAKGTGYWRRDADRTLDVLNGRAEATVVHSASDKVFLGFGVSGGGTGVDIAPFDGFTDAVSAGIRLVGAYVLNPVWAAAFVGERSWSWGGLAITRPGQSGGVRVERPVRERRTWGVAQLAGRYDAEAEPRLPDWLTVEPSIGAYLLHTRHEETRDNLGEAGTGPFGPTDVLALVRVSLAGAARLGSASPWSVGGGLGIDREVHTDMTDLVADATGFELSASLVRRLGVARRVMLSVTHYRGSGGLRQGTSLELIGVLDAEPWIPERRPGAR